MFLITRKIIFIHVFIMFSLHAEVFEGYTLFTPITLSQSGFITHLMNTSEEIIHTWSHERGPASMPYLLPDSSIIYPYRVEFPTMVSGGVGGGVQKLTWDGTIIWDYVFSDAVYQHHHDVEPLPSGNILIIVWENKSAEDAYAMGRQIIENSLNQMWSTAILELEPESGEIVWEWHLWDHLIQDVDPSLSNYGVISEHPELMNINYGDVGNLFAANADWMHVNAIDYNVILDQIVISSRYMNEVYIIDHSTTLEEAAGHIGGNYGKGGDFLYRWGNPEVYNRGGLEDIRLFGQHGVNWIEAGYPGEGSLIIFNNGAGRPEGEYSSVDVILPEVDESGNYVIFSDLPFGPEELTWTFSDNGSFFAYRQSGAYRMPNGNTLVTIAYDNRIIEVTLDGEIAWDYILNDDANAIPRAMKYGLDYLDNLILGDLNDDGNLNILDIVSLVNLVLSEDYAVAGDINQDDTLNILDIVSLVNLVLGN